LRPGEEVFPLQGLSFWESSPPMGPPESPTRPRKNQAAARRERHTRRPRARLCLLKACEQSFHPQQPRQRYCSERCRREARRWSRWKAQQRYRETAGGREKRNGQSRRYRERVKSQKQAEPESVSEPARVITEGPFCRTHVRPAGMLRAIPVPAPKSAAALLLRVLPTRAGTSTGAGAALEAGAALVRTY